MINKSNIEEKLFDYFEGNLSATEISEVDNFVQSNPEFKSDFDAWKQSYLPAETFEYKHANDLLVPENSKKALFGRWKTGLAMLLLSTGVSFGIYFNLQNNQNKTNGLNTLSNKNPDKTSKYAKKIKQIIAEEKSNESLLANESSNHQVKEIINPVSSGNSKTNINSKINTSYPNKTIGIVNSKKTESNHKNIVEEKLAQLNLINNHLPISIHKKAISKIANLINPNLQKKKNKFEKYDKNVVKFTNNKDPYLNFPNASALDMNPSFAGNGKGIRLNYLYHNQWPELSDNDKFVTQIISVDSYVKTLKGGVGILVSNDVMGHKKFTSQSFSLIYSPKFTLFGKTTIEPSLKYSYNKKGINWNQVKSDELIDPRNGTVDAIIANNPLNVAATHSTFSSFGTGLLLNTSKVYVGISYDYWANPNYNLDGYSQQIDVPGKFSAQFGGSLIPIKDKDFTFSPAVQFLKIGNWDNLWLSNTFEISKFFLSASMSVNKESMFSAGYNNDYLRISYAYGLTRPLVEPAHFLSSHQLCLRFNFVPVKK